MNGIFDEKKDEKKYVDCWMNALSWLIAYCFCNDSICVLSQSSQEMRLSRYNVRGELTRGETGKSRQQGQGDLGGCVCERDSLH